jgi:putative NIF3 family GTP cyclohydrolase 1 type 2
MVAVDCPSQVVDKALTKGFDLIVAYHPVIFHNIKHYLKTNTNRF